MDAASAGKQVEAFCSSEVSANAVESLLVCVVAIPRLPKRPSDVCSGLSRSAGPRLRLTQLAVSFSHTNSIRDVAGAILDDARDNKAETVVPLSFASHI
jgi:hypothetical protein